MSDLDYKESMKSVARMAAAISEGLGALYYIEAHGRNPRVSSIAVDVTASLQEANRLLSPTSELWRE